MVVNDSESPSASSLRPSWRTGPGTATAAALYILLTLVMTWPVVHSLFRALPADLGDPLLNTWILGWDVHHILRFLSGHLTALAGYWNANIFYPAPLALAYSEHLTAQAIEIAPIVALTGNLVLGYNLLFLSTFALSGLGAYLLARELTGNRWAAFAAGVCFAFLPYRFSQFPHLQVLSSQWMPLALYGFLRYFRTRRRWALAGAALALVAQNLSCGYFMVFFAVPLVAFVLAEIGRHHRWRDHRTWTDLIVAALGVTALTLPFALPYLELRALGFPPRGLGEVDTFAADVYSYLTAAPGLHLLGWLHAYSKPEGQLFPGFIASALGALGVGVAVREAWRGADAPDPGRRWRWLHWLAWPAAIVAVVYTGLWIAMLCHGPFAVVGTPVGTVKVMGGGKIIRAILVALVVVLVTSGRARAAARRFVSSWAGEFALLLLFAVWMSLGPILRSAGRNLNGGTIYLYFFEFVPGFNGLRVPARFWMLGGLFLSVLAGYGAAALTRVRRVGVALVVAVCLLALAESWAVPIPTDQRWPDFNHAVAMLPNGLPTHVGSFPPVYRYLRTLPAGASIVEFPFGEYPLTLRYMYFSTADWHPRLNGYSGGFPFVYRANRAALRNVLTNPARAWATLAQSGAAYAVVHDGLYVGRRGAIVDAWLTAHGAHQVAVFGRDHVFALPAP